MVTDEVLKTATNTFVSQYTFKHDGGIVSTTNFTIKQTDKYSLKIGRFYRPNNDDTYIGFKLIKKF